MQFEEGQVIKSILEANKIFRSKVLISDLPIERKPEQVAVITCMDPRVNLAALGIETFSADGAGHSNVRIIRTIGGIAEERSLIIGAFLAGIQEFIVLMHTDCGCCLAHSKIDVIQANMERMLSADQLDKVMSEWGELNETSLQKRLQTFDDPKKGIRREITRLKSLSYFPQSVTVHGLLYHVETAEVEVVVDGSAV